MFHSSCPSNCVFCVVSLRLGSCHLSLSARQRKTNTICSHSHVESKKKQTLRNREWNDGCQEWALGICGRVGYKHPAIRWLSLGSNVQRVIIINNSILVNMKNIQSKSRCYSYHRKLSGNYVRTCKWWLVGILLQYIRVTKHVIVYKTCVCYMSILSQ